MKRYTGISKKEFCIWAFIMYGAFLVAFAIFSLVSCTTIKNEREIPSIDVEYELYCAEQMEYGKECLSHDDWQLENGRVEVEEW